MFRQRMCQFIPLVCEQSEYIKTASDVFESQVEEGKWRSFVQSVWYEGKKKEVSFIADSAHSEQVNL